MAAAVPSVATPALAAPAAEGVDCSTLAFLTRQTLLARAREKREEEAEAKLKDEEEVKKEAAEVTSKITAGIPVTDAELAVFKRSFTLPSSSTSSGAKRKRKKRRKKKLPKASSSRHLPSSGAVHTWRSGHPSCGSAFGWFLVWVLPDEYVCTSVALVGISHISV